ncbi:hypothetical protein [Streptomyces chattanoogensis]|uniref:Gram-positive cocci surface proteins LPxTG domain-containing protein n=1 Tax=Streptomyces chattanoogensis TaxID=66876 RepID=A0A0N0XZF6_9ACTN|nr:hypothetical protein [Streptomyces chattanoogensis]KPC64905.1 hypothetical protein ADL29_09790 [Streptomyces chattanoogensis]
MGSPQLTFCAAVAACVVTTAPAYAGAENGTRTGTVSVTPATATARGTRTAVPHSPDSVRAGRAATAPGRPAHRSPFSEQAAANGELSSTSAVGLVLAGGALLVVAGQLLRLRLRLRRERDGGGSGDES